MITPKKKGSVLVVYKTVTQDLFFLQTPCMVLEWMKSYRVVNMYTKFETFRIR